MEFRVPMDFITHSIIDTAYEKLVLEIFDWLNGLTDQDSVHKYVACLGTYYYLLSFI